MKAVVFHAPGDIRVEDVPVPTCEAGGLRVKVDACAVCGSDLKASLVGNPRIKPPRIMGHEFTGLIDQVGAGAAGFAVGERVVMATSVSCGVCAYCRKGHPNLCADVAPMGFTYQGGMAEYVAIPALAVRGGHVIKVPRHVSATHAALAEPLSCCINAADNCNIRKGDVVLVSGAGPMGLLNACVARALGAGTIIIAEPNDARLASTARFHFDVLVNPDKQDLAQVVKDHTGGIGADVVIVAAPVAAPQEKALALVRKRGTVCLFASLPKERSTLSIDSRLIHYNEISVVGASDSTPKQVSKAIEIIANGSFPSDLVITHTLTLDDIQRSFALMKSGEALKVVLTLNGEAQQ